MKKIINFLFGKKYPIFNAQGEIEHSRKEFFKQWKQRYQKDSNKDWRNHSGLYYQPKEQNSHKKS